MILAERTFNEQDQRRFASASGDHNPMHMDALQARRTQAGAPVVHGIHLLLWALDSLAAAQPELPPLRKLRAQFNKFVYVNEPAEVTLTQQKPGGVRLNVTVDGVARAKFNFEFGESLASCPDWAALLEEIPASPMALDVKFEQMSGRSGKLAFQLTAGNAAAMFPAATRWLGARRIAALTATTHLVGMILPGLHSIYSDLSVSTCAADNSSDFLSFRADADSRFRTVDLDIAGGGFTGIVNSVARMPPVEQAGMESLAGLVAPQEFAGAVALIVGGSRGLGELTAKLIAKGGGRVIVTWQSGRADAERVAEAIRASGGQGETLAYDVRKPAAEQLAALSVLPTHMYYFATPVIFRPSSDVFTASRLQEFLGFYVDGFWALAQAMRDLQPGLSIYYPSSVFVEERPEGMTEYVMAKVAGEVLCADMNVSLAPMHVTQTRLPRLPTDQTASVVNVAVADPIETMLPLIREVQSWPK